MASVARRRGHEVRLWGTWLDDPMLEPCERGEPHPRLGLRLEGMTLLRSPRLAVRALAVLHHSAWAAGTAVAIDDAGGEIVAAVSELPFASDA